MIIAGESNNSQIFNCSNPSFDKPGCPEVAQNRITSPTMVRMLKSE